MILAALIIALQITTTALPPATAGQPYSAMLQADTPATWFLWQYAPLQNGLWLNADGTIGGTPVAPGTYSFTVFAQSMTEQTAPKTFSVVVQ